MDKIDNKNSKQWSRLGPRAMFGQFMLEIAEEFDDQDSNGIYDPGEPFNDHGNGKWDKGLDVVLVEIDAEAYRLIPWEWPYPRHVFALALKNLARAGAKVVAVDIQFDASDRESEYLRNFSNQSDYEGMRELLPIHSDSVFALAIKEVQAMELR